MYLFFNNVHGTCTMCYYEKLLLLRTQKSFFKLSRLTSCFFSVFSVSRGLRCVCFFSFIPFFFGTVKNFNFPPENPALIFFSQRTKEVEMMITTLSSFSCQLSISFHLQTFPKKKAGKRGGCWVWVRRAESSKSLTLFLRTETKWKKAADFEKDFKSSFHREQITDAAETEVAPGMKVAST